MTQAQLWPGRERLPSTGTFSVSSVINLALPFFGLILLGYVCARLVDIPEEGLGWMNVFVIYLALPALFFTLIAQTPVEELANWRFVVATTLSTLTVFVISFAIGYVVSHRNIPEATLQGIAGSYSNIGYMGPGLTLAVLGAGAAVPTALIFSFDNALLFILLPLFMALGGSEKAPPLRMARDVARKILLHPFILATFAGVLAALFSWQPPEALGQMIVFLRNAAAPCALFAMGVTVALRPLRRVSPEIPLHLGVKLIVHPFLVLAILGFVGGIDPLWVKTAVLMAALPPALNVFIIARHHNTYVERASSLVLIGTVVSTVTLTMFIYLATHDLLPIAH